jgi:hypothetical protein
LERKGGEEATSEGERSIGHLELIRAENEDNAAAGNNGWYMRPLQR